MFDTPVASTGDWSVSTLERLSADQALTTNLIVVAELMAHLKTPDVVARSLIEAQVEIVDMTYAVASRAGQAFREYRRRGGPRTTILADFLIAAHATVLGATLMTRDRRLASYFPDLTLLTPDTDNG